MLEAHKCPSAKRDHRIRINFDAECHEGSEHREREEHDVGEKGICTVSCVRVAAVRFFHVCLQIDTADSKQDARGACGSDISFSSHITTKLVIKVWLMMFEDRKLSADVRRQ